MDPTLTGLLEGFPLTAVLRLLVGSRATGCIHAASGAIGAPRGRSHSAMPVGYVALDRGWIVGAGLAPTLGGTVGLPALEALTLVASTTRLEFSAGAPDSERSIMTADVDALLAYLEGLEASARAAGLVGRLALTTVPQTAPLGLPPLGTGGAANSEKIAIERGALRTLLCVDGRRTVAEILTLRGGADAVLELAALTELGLVCLGPPDAASADGADAVDGVHGVNGAPAVHAPQALAARRQWGAELLYWSRSAGLAAVAGLLLALNHWQQVAPPPLR